MQSVANTHRETWKGWALMGPIFIILTLSLQLLKSTSPSFFLVGVGLCGILLCHQWRFQGLAVSLGALGSILFYRTFWGVSYEWFEWGSLLSLALSFVITALVEPQVVEDEEVALDEDLILKLQEKELLIKVGTDEVIRLNAQVEALKQHALETHHQKEKLQEKFEELEARRNLLSRQSEARSKEIKDLQEEKAKLQALLQEKIQESLTERERLQEKERQLKESLSEKEELEKQLQEELSRKESLPEEKGPYWQEYKRFEGLHNQLRMQFEEKSLQLDTARKELFSLQELMERERNEHKEKQEAEESYYERYILTLTHQIKAQEKEIVDLQEVVTKLS